VNLLSTSNNLVIDGHWWVSHDEETAGNVKAIISMIRERLQLRRPANAVILLPSDNDVAGQVAEMCLLMGLEVLECQNPEEMLYKISKNYIDSDDISVWLSGRETLFPLALQGAVIEKNNHGDLVQSEDLKSAGLDTEQKLTDWLALSGTPSPVKRMGPARAFEALADRSLEEIFADKGSDRLLSTIKSQEARIRENLAHLDTLKHTPKENLVSAWIQPGKDKVQRLLEIYTALGWHEWCDEKTRLPMNSIENPLSAKAQIALLQSLTTEVLGVKIVAADDKVREVHVSRGEGAVRNWVFKLSKYNEKVMLEQLSPLLSSKKVKKVVSDHKILSKVLIRHNLPETGGVIGDMSALTSYEREKTDLTEMSAERYVQYHAAKISGFTKKQSTNYLKIDVKIGQVLAKMESSGIAIDQYGLDCYQLETQNSVMMAARNIEELMGVRPTDTDEFKKSLRVTLGLPSSSPLDANVLRPLAQKTPLAQYILAWRQQNTISQSFITPITSRTDKDGCVRTSFECNAITGRLSSSRPALQNLPVATPGSMGIRNAFVPRSKEASLLSIDYKQMEIVILAIASGDTKLLKALESGEDIHRRAAAEMFNVADEVVSDEQRTAAKAINFGIIYGMTQFGVAKKLGITDSKASALIGRHKKAFPDVHRFVAKRIKQANQSGTVTTLSGRKISLDGLYSSDRSTRQKEERKIVNYEMQGSAAEMVKKAMIDVQEYLEKSAPETKLIMQIHDELVLDVPDDDIHRVADTAIRLMKNACHDIWGIDAGRYFNLTPKIGKNLAELEVLTVCRPPAERKLSSLAPFI
jgi:DNA polymerase I-like protein with 3'-5' exonuclease and polymerase domains